MTLDQGNEILTNAKNELIANLRDLALLLEKARSGEAIGTLHDEAGLLVSAHTRLISELGRVIYEIHKTTNLYKYAATRDDVLSTSRNLVDTSFQFWKMYKDASVKGLPVVSIAPGAYDHVQRLFNSFLPKDELKIYHDEFLNLGIKPLPMIEELPDKPVPINHKGRIRTSIAVGAISILIVFAIFLTKEQIPSQFAMMLQALFALGLGGLSAALLGGVTVKFQFSPIGSAIGGFAVMFIVWFYPPVVPFDTFQVWISLRDKDGNVVPTKDRLFLDFPGGGDPEGLNTGGEYLFSNISSNKLKDTVETYLMAPAEFAFKKSKSNRIFVKLTLGETRLEVINSRDSITSRRAGSTLAIRYNAIR